MENPATWNDTQRIIHSAINEWHQNNKDGFIGYSLATYIYNVLKKNNCLIEKNDRDPKLIQLETRYNTIIKLEMNLYYDAIALFIDVAYYLLLPIIKTKKINELELSQLIKSLVHHGFLGQESIKNIAHAQNQYSAAVILKYIKELLDSCND